ncbi:hypothetical protein D3C86_1221270 [compost metagenome]
MAFRAQCFSPVTRQQYPVLDFIGLALNKLEEPVDPGKMLVSFPQYFQLFFCEFFDRSMDGEIEFSCILNQFFQVFAHYVSFPGHNRTFINTQAWVRNDQVRINPDDGTVTFTGFTGPKGIVECKEVRRRLHKCHIVQFEAIGKRALLHGCHLDNGTISMAFHKSQLNGISQTTGEIIVHFLGHHPVHNDHDRIRKR